MHCHPKVIDALTRQAATLNTDTRYLNDKIINYSEHLASTMPAGLGVCLYTCTGTESNELAMRMARKITGNHGIIIMEHAYHGNSTLIHELSSCLYPPDECPDYVAMVEPPNVYRGSFRRSQGLSDDERDLLTQRAERVLKKGADQREHLLDEMDRIVRGMAPA